MESCEKYRLIITQLAENGSEITDASLLNHVNSCEACKALYEETKSLLGILKNIELREPPEGFAQTISDKSHAAFINAKKHRLTSVYRLRRLTIPAVAAAAIFLAMFINIISTHQHNNKILYRAQNAVMTPEDVALATFTDEQLVSVASSKADTYETTESAESQPSVSDIEWVETQLPQMVPSSSETDLFYLVESLSADEAELIYESLEGADS